LACSKVWGSAAFAEQAPSTRISSPFYPKEMPFAQAALLGCGVVTGAGCVLKQRMCPQATRRDFRAGGVGLSAVSGARIAGRRGSS